MKRKEISRRKFIQSSSTAVVTISASGLITPFLSGEGKKHKIPLRKFGNTGLDVSILSFGAGTQFLQNNDGEWEKILEAAVEGGINLFDTAPSYCASKFYQIGDGKSLDSSEERFGQILPSYRDKIILSTKLETRDPNKAKTELEGSLKRMKTDHVDILLIHGIGKSDSIIEIEKGLYKTMLGFKESGMVKLIGFSCMQDAQHGAEMLDKLDFDVILLAMNATKYGGFAETVVPVAEKKNTGILAMKIMRDIVGKAATPKELLAYAWSQKTVSSALVGHHGLETLADNIRLAKEFDPNQLAELDKKALETRLAGLAGPHALCWANHGYRDGSARVNLKNGFIA